MNAAIQWLGRASEAGDYQALWMLMTVGIPTDAVARCQGFARAVANGEDEVVPLLASAPCGAMASR
jgi:hypothetical protein